MPPGKVESSSFYGENRTYLIPGACVHDVIEGMAATALHTVEPGPIISELQPLGDWLEAEEWIDQFTL